MSEKLWYVDFSCLVIAKDADEAKAITMQRIKDGKLPEICEISECSEDE